VRGKVRQLLVEFSAHDDTAPSRSPGGLGSSA
jgi:hypothetical protein